ncbi:GNAT family N-acetyltransferase [Paenibacillus sp. SC116]|uniref:GNAT family N-acetyltransferase n=1 Tax=Paenibacillus sp. SC116 TaxID=2968986 RepID=UPI00215AFB7D|nr:GNAT family N-acetyltransferase [Paenibacillus sp. SC116]MCR8845895.1 GNAT family N-acetyltransferase [Paenibacillus sp. SC116]
MESTSRVTIECLTIDDLEALVELYKELVDHELHVDQIKTQFLRLQNNEDYYIIGAKNEAGQLMGTAMGIVCHDLLLDCRSFMVIENVVVSSNYRGLGIGKLLMERIEQLAIERDCYRTQLFSSAVRLAAHPFYESIGYDRESSIGFVKYL